MSSLTQKLIFFLLTIFSLSIFANDPSEIVEKLKEFKFSELGVPEIKSDYIYPIASTKEHPHHLLILPVQFADKKFNHFSGDNAQIKNHYSKMLFGDGLDHLVPNTLTHYYYDQSYGKYYVTGTVLPLITVPKEKWYYGKPRKNFSGDWRDDNDTKGLVIDALREAYKNFTNINWKELDNWDPKDYDHDGITAEPDGYIDHLILVYEGDNQSDCGKLKHILNAKADPSAVETLQGADRECAERIWPKRSALTTHLDYGPIINGRKNIEGGIPLKETGLNGADNLPWVKDYNIQSENTSIATFIHEFGHSLGLPDIYARETTNSTAMWEVMSGTAKPYPQQFSAWSKIMFGWLEKDDVCVITPPGYGGQTQIDFHLQLVNEKVFTTDCKAIMVILPPKEIDLKLAKLKNGKQAAYTAKGNDINHYLTKEIDLTKIKNNAELTFSTLFDIETEWDYLYVEVSTNGSDFFRILPVDKENKEDKQSIMASTHGHEGLEFLPGLTGISGDLDGDGKVELNQDCKPEAVKKTHQGNHAEPCERPAWIDAHFDLTAYKGKKISIRFHYFTDGASVYNGAVIDDVVVNGDGTVLFQDDFENDFDQSWKVKGFTLTSGQHHISIPHFYVLEYRDPYASLANNSWNYDKNLSTNIFYFYHKKEKQFNAVKFQPRPGIVMWYYNGEFAWGDNDPITECGGPGNGFLLVVDSNPQEFNLQSFNDCRVMEDGFSHFDYNKKDFWANQATETANFCQGPDCKMNQIKMADFQLIGADYWKLPLEERGRYVVGLPFTYPIPNEKGDTVYRTYNYLNHSVDAPFSCEKFNTIEYFEVKKENLVPLRNISEEYCGNQTVSHFDDSREYQNKFLRLGGVKVPHAGLTFEVQMPEADSDAKAKIIFNWK